MKVYIVISYDSIFDGEQIDMVFSSLESAEEHCEMHGVLRVEEWEVEE